MPNPSSGTMSRLEPPPFTEHVRAVMQELRLTLLDLFLGVDADPSRPQDVSRRFGLNKNLTWKIGKIVAAEDLLTAVPHVPGRAGLEIVLNAMRDAGADQARLDAVARAAAALDDVVRVHTDDRATLEIMVDGELAVPQQAETLRRTAYQCGSATWGVRATAQISLNVMVPSTEGPGLVDLAQVGGLVGFRRLRRGSRWLLIRREHWRDGHSTDEPDPVEPLDPDGVTDAGVPLIRQFCSSRLPTIEAFHDNREIRFELPPGPVGNTAAFDCIYGTIVRPAGPDHATRSDEYTEIGTTVMTPCEHVFVDLLVHRDCRFAMNPGYVLCGRLDGTPLDDRGLHYRHQLPATEPVLDLGTGLGGLATPVLPWHGDLARFVIDRLGAAPSDFRAYRVAMAYPPMPAALLYHVSLPMLD